MTCSKEGKGGVNHRLTNVICKNCGVKSKGYTNHQGHWYCSDKCHREYYNSRARKLYDKNDPQQLFGRTRREFKKYNKNKSLEVLEKKYFVLLAKLKGCEEMIENKRLEKPINS